MRLNAPIRTLERRKSARNRRVGGARYKADAGARHARGAGGRGLFFGAGNTGGGGKVRERREHPGLGLRVCSPASASRRALGVTRVAVQLSGPIASYVRRERTLQRVTWCACHARRDRTLPPVMRCASLARRDGSRTLAQRHARFSTIRMRTWNGWAIEGLDVDRMRNPKVALDAFLQLHIKQT